MHEGTEYTPHELIFAKTARIPTTQIFPEDINNESYTHYLENLYNKIRISQENARSNLINAKLRSKKYYDRRINPYNFKRGDKIFLLKEPTHKLGDQYTGPHEIIEIF